MRTAARRCRAGVTRWCKLAPCLEPCMAMPELMGDLHPSVQSLCSGLVWVVRGAHPRHQQLMRAARARASQDLRTYEGGAGP